MNAGFSLLPDLVETAPPRALETSRRRRAAEIALPVVRVRRLAPRDLLFHEGEPTGDLHEICRGTVLVVRRLADGRRQIVDVAGAGRLVGLAAGDRHGCTAIAVRPTVAVGFDRDAGREDPLVAERIERAALAEIECLRELALTLGRRTAVERLAAFFCGLAGDAVASVEIPLPVGRGEIADHLGLTLETVSRTVGRLKRRGLVEETGDLVRLPDLPGLRRLASGGEADPSSRTKGPLPSGLEP